MSAEKIAVKTTYISIASNTLLAIIKFTAGILGNSYALIADAIESTTDIFSSIFLLFGIKYSNKPPDKKHPYGHGRIEPVITFIVVGFLIISATVIGYESIQHILTPQETPESWTLIVLGVIIIWKEISYRIVLKKSIEINSSALKADAWHHRSDAITSIAAFIGISIALVFGEGYETADDWAALFAATFIIYNAYLISKPALSEIMDEHMYDDLIHEIRFVANNVEGIIDTEKCLIRKTGLKYHVDLHAIVDANITVKEGHSISHKLKDTLMEKIPNLAYILIHVEPYR